MDGHLFNQDPLLETTGVVSDIVLTSPLILQPGTYGFYVGGTNVGYKTHVTGSQTIFSDILTTIETGPNTGYGGSVPTPTNHPRQFCGNIKYTPLSSAPNDISLSNIFSPNTYCVGDTSSLIVEVSNFGNNPVDSFMVFWEINSLVSSSWFYNALDTFGGLGSTSATINLQNLTMAAGATNIKTWTALPNNITDTANGNDTINVNLNPSLFGTYTIGGTTPDYVTIDDARIALEANGVCGPITFNLRAGTYNEQITFDEIIGTSSTNTVTFTFRRCSCR